MVFQEQGAIGCVLVFWVTNHLQQLTAEQREAHERKQTAQKMNLS